MSYRNAVFGNEVPGVVVPDEVVERGRFDDPEDAKKGVAIAHEQRPSVAGIQVSVLRSPIQRLRFCPRVCCDKGHFEIALLKLGVRLILWVMFVLILKHMLLNS